jgi:hypothetical protein
MTNYNPKLQSFVSGCQALLDKENLCSKPVLEVRNGTKYTKVIRKDTVGSSASVYAFIDKTNGDVLKPAGFNAPAKHARGNIFDEANGLAHMSWHGPAYLR